jgi:deoxycytidylate deaminase
MNTDEREAFLALIAPIGINIEEVVHVLSEKASQINYTPHTIKLTDTLKDLKLVEDSYPHELARYKAYIAAGDQLCQDTDRGDILVLFGIARLLKGGEVERRSHVTTRRLNIFRQIKRPAEHATLERTYGRNILFVGCFAPKDSRVSYLVKKLKARDRLSNDAALESQALDIISIDEDESDHEFGQKVIDCYPKSDFILDCTSRRTLESSCERLLNIYFGHPFISPTRDEYASYIANAAAYRSLDLSRQVGAAIFGPNGEIISMGCNEVPAAGGGTYWCDQSNDARDFVLGYDSNQRVREDMARDALAKLKDKGWISSELTDRDINALAREVFQSGSKEDGIDAGPWRDSMISDVIEYGRMVHAEMNALTDAARFRRSTQGATLYCTTMPCHMCAKLIIAAGIDRVVYVQPYVKSLTAELFEDSVVLEGRPNDERVNFESLKGVTPAGFKRAFAKSYKRKNEDGSAKVWDKLKSKPSFLTAIPYYVDLEIEVLDELREIMPQ